MNTRICLFVAPVLLSVPAAMAAAQGQTFNSWSAYWENDSFVPSKYSSDKSYTNGVRFTLGRKYPWKWADRASDVMRMTIPLTSRGFETSSALTFGQNFFTPIVITTFSPDPADRPFAAFLYGGVRVDATEGEPIDARKPHRRVQHSLELDGGFIGPLALADHIQTGVHLLRKNRIPKGWEQQLGTELAVNGQYTARVKLGTNWLDLIPHAGVALGTVQTFGHAGATARIGVNMSSFPALLNPWAAVSAGTRPNFELALALGLERRYYLRNAYVDGSLIGGSPEVEKTPGVTEGRVGLTVRIKTWSGSLTFVRRTPEFDAPDSLRIARHHFGSLSFTRELGLPPASGDRGHWLTRDWTFDAGIGGGTSRDHPVGGTSRSVDGMSMRVAAARRIINQINIGAEMVGVVREDRAAGPDGRHRDMFLNVGAITAAWRPAFRSRGHFNVRLGVGTGTAKVQVTRGLSNEYERDDRGSAVLAAFGYDYELGGEVSLGIDATWSKLGVASSRGPDASLLGTTFGFKWRPSRMNPR